MADGETEAQGRKLVARTRGHTDKSWGLQAPYTASSHCSEEARPGPLGSPPPGSLPWDTPVRPSEMPTSACVWSGLLPSTGGFLTRPRYGGPSRQGHWGRRRAHPWTGDREPPQRPVSVTADGDKQQVCAGRPPGRATHRPTPRSSECQTGSDGLGRGRATPDTLKVKTSHVMPRGRAPASSLPPYPPALTSLPATPPRCGPPVPRRRDSPPLYLLRVMKSRETLRKVQTQ